MLEKYVDIFWDGNIPAHMIKVGIESELPEYSEFSNTYLLTSTDGIMCLAFRDEEEAHKIALQIIKEREN